MSAAAAPEGAAAATGVMVTGPGGAVGTVSEEVLKAGTPPNPTSYWLRAKVGEAGESISRGGMPVRQVVEASTVPFVADGYLTVPRPNGTVAYLPALDFEEPSPVFEGGNPALVTVDSGSVRFFRPLTVEDPGGVNAEDNIATVSGEALRIGVHDGNILIVEATASVASTEAGAPVQFTATAFGGREGESFTYAWSFGDGGTATGTTVTHSFAGSGTYEVRVTAVGSDESGGESPPIGVVVGDPPTTDQTGAAEIPQAEGRQPTGAPGRGGQARGGKGGRHSGHRTLRADPSRQAAGPTRRPTGKQSSHSAPPENEGPPRAATPTPSPVPTPEPTSAGSVEEAAESDSVSSTSSTRGRPPGPDEEVVEGRLVGDMLPSANLEATTETANGQGTRSAAGAVGGGGNIEAPAVVLIVVGLLFGGALYEWKRSRPLS